MPRITDLEPRYFEDWLHCFEPWSAEMTDGRDRKAAWYDRMKDRGLFVKLAIDDDGKAVGMIQVVPIEESFARGANLAFVECVWVHGHRRGVGKRQGRGLGTALVEAAEAEAHKRGALGIAAWGVVGPVWMRASWWRHNGYVTSDRDQGGILLWKPFEGAAEPPFWPEPMAPRTAARPRVTCLSNGWCTAMNAVCARAERVARSMSDVVDYREIDTQDREEFARWGRSDAVFVDGRQIQIGPPPSERKIRKVIRQAAKRRSASIGSPRLG